MVLISCYPERNRKVAAEGPKDDLIYLCTLRELRSQAFARAQSDINSRLLELNLRSHRPHLKWRQGRDAPRLRIKSCIFGNSC